MGKGAGLKLGASVRIAGLALLPLGTLPLPPPRINDILLDYQFIDWLRLVQGSGLT